MGGELKTVTVMFADLSGSLTLIEDLDPEDAGEAIQPVIDAMVQAVHQYGGYLCRVMGDGVMALFGAPTAQEDHALRACLAGWEICTSVAALQQQNRSSDLPQFSVRVGLNSGEVMVGDVLTDGAVEIDVVGQVVHVASRMQAMAAKNSVWMTGDTHRLVADFVKARHLGKRAIRGLSSRMELYQLAGIGDERMRFRAHVTRGLSTLIGREKELNDLERSVEQFRNGAGQTIAITGPAGIGKSRLLFELVEKAVKPHCRVVEVQSLPYDRGRYFVPIHQILRSLLQIDSDDGRDEIIAKLGRFHQQYPTVQARSLDALKAILIDRDTETGWQSINYPDRRLQVNTEVVNFVVAISQVTPLVIVWEDVHWIDADSRLTLETLAGRVGESQVLLLASLRDDVPGNLLPLDCDVTIDLKPLTDANCLDLLDHVLGNDDSLEPVKETAVEKAAGNPLFLEEMIRELTESGVLLGGRGQYRRANGFKGAQVPVSISGLMGNRIDRLTKSERELLEAAAVVGTRFQFPILAMISGKEANDNMNKLLDAGLITHGRAESQFAFSHPLMQEVAYRRVTRRRRMALHRQVVDAIESKANGKLVDRDLQQLAYHSWEGQDWQRAVDYLLRAGRLALSKAANRSALQMFQKAKRAAESVQRMPDSPDRMFEISLDTAAAAFALGDGGQYIESIRGAEELARSSNDSAQLAWAYSHLALYNWMSGKPIDADDSASKAYELARQSGDSYLQVHTLLRRGLTSQGRGHYRRSLEILLDALGPLGAGDEFERYGLAAPGTVLCKATIARDYAELGDFKRAVEYGTAAKEISERAGDPFGIVYAYRELGIALLRQGDLVGANELLGHGLKLCGETDVGLLFPRMAGAAGYAQALCGEHESGIANLQRAAEVGEALNVPVYLSLVHVWLSEAYLLEGKLSEALAEANTGVQQAIRYEETSNSAWALKTLGDVHMAFGPEQLSDAIQAYEKCEAIAEEQGLLPLLAKCRFALGEAYESLGRSDIAMKAKASAKRIQDTIGLHLDA